MMTFGKRRVFLLIVALPVVLAAIIAMPASVALAQSAACVNTNPMPIRAPAPVAAAANLPAPFGYRPPADDRSAVLRDVAAVVVSSRRPISALTPATSRRSQGSSSASTS